MDKILLCHNYYQQPGGEDQSFAEEAQLLESRGHTVIRYTQHNDAIHEMSAWTVAARTLWNRRVFNELRALVRRERPAVMHCTNTFPLISPAAYYAAAGEGVAVVQSLRNYRLLCPGAYFMREGRVCEDCLGTRFPWPAVVHGCYRGSRVASAVVSSMLTMHRLLGSWSRRVDRYFALTEFSRHKFIEGGIPPAKISVKPNFLQQDPGPGGGSGDYVAFVGRLSPEKGVDILLDLWKQDPSLPSLKILGDGPLTEAVQAAAKANHSIEWLGRMNSHQVLQIVGEASCLLQPSRWYEGFPRTILEALARGTPVIASDLGSMAEIIEDGRSGILAEPTTGGFQWALGRFLAHRESWPAMRRAAREAFVSKYSAATNYELLMEIYRAAREEQSAANNKREGRPK